MAMLPKKLTDTLIRTHLNKLEPGEWSDPSTPGFSIWIAKPDRTGQRKVTFNSRISVAGKGRKATRPRQFLASWKDQSPVMGLDCDEARRAFEERKEELTNPEIAKKKRTLKVPTLAEAISLYVVQRRDKRDQQTAPKGQALPKNWDEMETRFRTMMGEKHLGEPVNLLDRDAFIERKVAYLNDLEVAGHARMTKSALAKRGGEKVIADHKLRGMFSAMGPMLQWFVKKDWLKIGDIADLRPQQYAADTRFLYPGEWQVTCPRFDEIGDGGLFMRFLTLTGSRVTAALRMQWSDLPRFDKPLTLTVNGESHDCLIWLARTKGHDSVKHLGEETAPQRILLIGETMTILRQLRKSFEANRKEGDTYDGVFSPDVLAKWSSNPAYWQRRLEANIEGMIPWDRHTLRRTHATYMGYVGTPRHLISTSLTHAMDAKGKKHADTTDIYALDDTGDDFGEGDPLKDVAPYLLRLQLLFRDFERGRITPPVERLQSLLMTGPQSIAMRERYKVAPRWISLRESAVKLTVVA